jgi:two-component system, sensor histidine kinase PdtaS
MAYIYNKIFSQRIYISLLLLLSFTGQVSTQDTKPLEIDTIFINKIFKDVERLSSEDKRIYVITEAFNYEISNPNFGLRMLAWLEKQKFFKDDFSSGYLFRKGVLLKNSGAHTQAVAIFLEALKKAEIENDTLNRAAIYFKLSDTYDEMADFRKKAESARKSLVYYSMLKDTINMVQCYLKMSVASKNNISSSDATTNIKKLLHLSKDNPFLRSKVYSSLANIFEGQKMIDSSFKYNKFFLNSLTLDNLADRFVAYYNLGQNLRDLKKYKESQEYTMNAYTINQTLKIDVYDVYAKIALSEIELKLGNTDKSKSWLVDMDPSKLNLEQQKQFANINYLIAKDKREFENALKYLEGFKMYSDSTFNIENAKVIGELKSKYDFESKEKEVVNLEKITEVKSKQIGTQNIFLITLTGLIALLLGLLYKTVKQKGTITAKNEQITKMLDEKDLLLREIHHRVKNNLQVVSSLLNLQSNYITDDIALEAINEGKNRVLSMALIHQNLYSDEHLTAIETKGYFDDLLDQLFESYNIDEEQIKLEKDIDNFLIDVDTMIPLGLITNELISNALKHAFKDRAEGKILFSVKNINGNIIIAIKDNGVGVEPSLFTASRSFGNKMIQAFVQKLKANLEVRNDSGTEIVITIPIDIAKAKRA